MLRDKEACSPIIYSDEVIFRPHAIWRITPVQQDNMNAGTIERGDDSFVDRVLFRRVFQRGEEDSGNLLGDISVAELLRLFLLLRSLTHRMPPEQRVRLRQRR